MTKDRLKRIGEILGILQPLDALRYVMDRGLLPPRRPEYALQPTGLVSPLVLRSGESDKHVFGQIFVDAEYKPLLHRAPRARVIVDCGANVGFSTAWLAAAYPDSRIVAVEADERNVVQLRRNVRQFGDRVASVHAGIWTDDRGLKIERGRYRGGGAWATQVRLCQARETPDIESLSISGLMQRFEIAHVDILKMDIEGAEVPVLAKSSEWINCVSAVVIELHDDAGFGNATKVFTEVMERERFVVFATGELMVGIRPNRNTASFPVG
jgi:FkbM family methyltransferase